MNHLTHIREALLNRAEEQAAKPANPNRICDLLGGTLGLIRGGVKV
jgi:hypothetical protein